MDGIYLRQLGTLEHLTVLIMGVMTMILLKYDCVESLDSLKGMIGHKA